MPVSVSRRSLLPRAAELICARFTLSAIAGSPGKERTCKQAAILEGKPGIGHGPIGKAHAEALVLSPGASIVAFPVLRGQREGCELDLAIGGVARVHRGSCLHSGYGTRSLPGGRCSFPAQPGK